MQTFLFKVTCENYKVHRNNLINLTISLSLHRGGFKVLISSRVTTIHQTVIGETNTKTLFISKKHILVHCFSAVILLLKRSRKILFWSKQSQSFRRRKEKRNNSPYNTHQGFLRRLLITRLDLEQRTSHHHTKWFWLLP